MPQAPTAGVNGCALIRRQFFLVRGRLARFAWLVAASTLASSSLGVSEPALAQLRPLTPPTTLPARRPATLMPSGINVNTNNTPIFVTLQSGVQVVIPPGGIVDAVNLANTTGTIATPGADAQLIVNGAFIDNNSGGGTVSGLRIQASGDATITATDTAIDVTGTGNTNGIWAIVLPSSDPTTQAKVGYDGPGITVTGGANSTAIQAENRGQRQCQYRCSRKFNCHRRQRPQLFPLRLAC